MKIINPLNIDLNKILGNKEEKEVVENKTLTDMKKMILDAKNILLLTHESPDGDAIGSTLAMHHALKQLEKDSDMYIPEYSRLFKFLRGTDEIKNRLKGELEDETKSESESEPDVELEYELKNDVYDLVIALDCSDEQRLEGTELFESAKNTIQIDHHGTNTMFADINFVNPTAPACAQILITIFEYFGLEITKEIGESLVTGIITDTGGFQYQGVTAETFEFAAELLRTGIDIPKIYSKVLQTKTKSSFELQKRVIDRLEFLEDGKIAFSYITGEDQQEVNAEHGDHEGLVNIGREVEGVEVSIFVREDLEKEGYKISMRSTGDANVSDICFLFGGGGHPRAAGCFIKGSLEQVRKKILAETKKAMQVAL